MSNSLANEHAPQEVEDLASGEGECDIIPLRPRQLERESLSDDFVYQLEAWVRHALTSNGFGDY